MKFKCGIASDVMVIYCHSLVDKASFVKTESINMNVVNLGLRILRFHSKVHIYSNLTILK